jgi:hypothetical protein
LTGALVTESASFEPAQRLLDRAFTRPSAHYPLKMAQVPAKTRVPTENRRCDSRFAVVRVDVCYIIVIFTEYAVKPDKGLDSWKTETE